MRVADLLDLEALDLTLRWGEDALVKREIGGVTVTDLEDPARFVRRGDVVLSGLVWWTPKQGRAKAGRFVSALRAAGAAALLAGEETHGAIPDALVDACREHGVPLLTVPARTNFRDITDAVYLRRWGPLSDRLSTGHALSETTRQELERLLAAEAPLSALLDCASASLGDLACYVVTATGRTLARTASAVELPDDQVQRGTSLRIDTDPSPYSAWYLHVPAVTEIPPRALDDLAEVVARHRDALAPRRSAQQLVSAVSAAADETSLHAALHECGLPVTGPYLVLALTLHDAALAASVLDEALGHARVPFAIAELPHGEAVAIARPESCVDTRARLTAGWPALKACAPQTPLPAGISAPARTSLDLLGALDQARHARTASTGARLAAAEEVTSLAALLSGLPGAVQDLYRTQVLGPLLHYSASAPTVLLETLETFLANNGSWTRTAEALHVHVNTVHYRIQRIEHLTGRDLVRLDHRADLLAALRCHHR